MCGGQPHSNSILSGSFGRTQQLWKTTRRSVRQFIGQFRNLLSTYSTKCTLYCDHKPLALFFTTAMSSPMLDRWALELQKFDIRSQHIQGKKNVVADEDVPSITTLLRTPLKRSSLQTQPQESQPIMWENLIWRYSGRNNNGTGLAKTRSRT